MRSPVAREINRLDSVHASPAGAVWRAGDGSVERIAPAQAALRAHEAQPVLCHARALARRLGVDSVAGLDVLELFAFVHPASFCLPTPRGLADAVGLAPPTQLEEVPNGLIGIADALIADLVEREALDARDPWARPIAKAMHDGGWGWGRLILLALGEPDPGPPGPIRAGALEIWRDLQEWSEHAPSPPPSHLPVDESEARERLANLLGTEAEVRPTQAEYAGALSAAFQPRERESEPTVVLAEAGTGVGKTLGYLAPASVWAEKNDATVWLSTYTKNLQHQIDGELDRLYPDPVAKALRVVVRKGRENYLCLLNLDEASRTLPMQPQYATALGLMARWARATRDGDLQGGDFPAWLSDILGRGRTLGLADRRGECIYSACPHYNKCFIERSVRRARRARIVIANHALVMIQAALEGVDDATVPSRYVFDEGHHVFDAADGAFSAHLSAQEAVELRRWLLGAEVRRSGRARGLRRRVEDLVADQPSCLEMVEQIEAAARALPGDGWMNRLTDDQPKGPTEAFLARVRQQVYARADDPRSPYGLQCDVDPAVDGLLDAAGDLERALKRLVEPMSALRTELLAMLDDRAEELDTPTRLRIEAAARSLTRRGDATIEGWRSMLSSLEGETPVEFVDWMAVDRIDGRDVDIGLHRHWVDPTRPFIETVTKAAHGVVITSATLRDGSGDEERDWQAAEARTGAPYLTQPAIRTAVASPFDYPSSTRFSSSAMSARTIWIRWPRPTGFFSRRPEAGDLACSRRLPGCGPSTKGSPPTSTPPVCRSTPNTSTA